MSLAAGARTGRLSDDMSGFSDLFEANLEIEEGQSQPCCLFAALRVILFSFGCENKHSSSTHMMSEGRFKRKREPHSWCKTGVDKGRNTGGCWESGPAGTPWWLASAADWQSVAVAADGASGAVLQDHIHSAPAKNGAEIHIESSQIYRRCRRDGCSLWNRPVFRPKEAAVGETCLEVRVSRVLGFKHNRLHKWYHMFVKAAFMAH